MGQAGQVGHNTNNNIHDMLKIHDKEISQLVCKYSHIICPWIDHNLFGNEGHPDINLNDDDACYKLAWSALDGNIAELYNFLPSKFHEMVGKYSKFCSVVSKSIPPYLCSVL